LDEIGITLGENLVSAPQKKKEVIEEDEQDKELEARLANLKR